MDAYRHPAAMEPLLPRERNARLSELTCEILKASGRLTGQVHSPHVLQRVVRTLVDEGEIPRARVQEITGKGATVSVEIIKLGFAEGLVEIPTPKGPLRPALPAKVDEFYFPQLFLYLPVDGPAFHPQGEHPPTP